MGFCDSLDPEDDDGLASTGFAVGPEPSGAAAISEYRGRWAPEVMRILRWRNALSDRLRALF